jgi:hypothetical protein
VQSTKECDTFDPATAENRFEHRPPVLPAEATDRERALAKLIDQEVKL